MTILEMFEQSGILTLLGISVVFGFLIIMVVVISQAGRIFTAMDAHQAAVGNQAEAATAVAAKAASSNSAPVTAAIVAAVGAYRKSTKKG